MRIIASSDSDNVRILLKKIGKTKTLELQVSTCRNVANQIKTKCLFIKKYRQTELLIYNFICKSCDN